MSGDSRVQWVPPLLVSRVVGVYEFEGGGFIALVGSANVATEDALEMAEEIIRLKREELARIKIKQEQPS